MPGFDDFINLLTIKVLLIAVFSASVSVVSLANYARIPSRRLLGLSVAFLLLALDPLVELFFQLPILQVAGLTVLVGVFAGEVKDNSIQIGKPLILAAVVLVATSGLFWLGFEGTPEFTPFLLVQIGLGFICSALVLTIIAFLISHHRKTGNRNALLVLIGFVFLFITNGVGQVWWMPFVSRTALDISGTTLIGIIYFVNIAGYVAFCIAILKARVVRK